jgi:hypothetical protein
MIRVESLRPARSDENASCTLLIVKQRLCPVDINRLILCVGRCVASDIVHVLGEFESPRCWSCHIQHCLIVWCSLQDTAPLLMGDGQRSEAEPDSNGGFPNLDFSQINLFERVLIESGLLCLRQQDRPVLYLVCWKHAVRMRPLELLAVSS